MNRLILRRLKETKRQQKSTQRQLRKIKTERQCNPEPQRPRRNQIWICADGWRKWNGEEWVRFNGEFDL